MSAARHHRRPAALRLGSFSLAAALALAACSGTERTQGTRPGFVDLDPNLRDGGSGDNLDAPPLWGSPDGGSIVPIPETDGGTVPPTDTQNTTPTDTRTPAPVDMGGQQQPVDMGGQQQPVDMGPGPVTTWTKTYTGTNFTIDPNVAGEASFQIFYKSEHRSRSGTITISGSVKSVQYAETSYDRENDVTVKAQVAEGRSDVLLSSADELKIVRVKVTVTGTGTGGPVDPPPPTNCAEAPGYLKADCASCHSALFTTDADIAALAGKKGIGGCSQIEYLRKDGNGVLSIALGLGSGCNFRLMTEYLKGDANAKMECIQRWAIFNATQ